MALQEHCCFYATKSGIVRDKIKKLQEDLAKRRKELFDNPLWGGLSVFFPFLLPLLAKIDVKMQPIQVHYQKMEMADTESYEQVLKGLLIMSRTSKHALRTCNHLRVVGQ